MFEKERVDIADRTLDRLVSDWSESSFALQPVDTTSREIVCRHYQAEERTDFLEEEPMLLLDWKIWLLKIAVFVVIPVVIVTGGGIKKLTRVAPLAAEFCQRQHIFLEEVIIGRKTPDLRLSLASSLHDRGEEREALEQARHAAQQYALGCARRSQGVEPLEERTLQPYLDGLRESLLIAARAATVLNETDESKRYWSLYLGSARQEQKPDDLKKLGDTAFEASEAARQAGDYRQAAEIIEQALTSLAAYQNEIEAIYKLDLKNKDAVSSKGLDAYRTGIWLHLRSAALKDEAGLYTQSLIERAAADTLTRHLILYCLLDEIRTSHSFPDQYQELTVQFRIEQAGSLLDNRIVNSSGIAVSDSMARKIIEKLCRDQIWNERAQSRPVFSRTLEPYELTFDGKTVRAPGNTRDQLCNSVLLGGHETKPVDYRRIVLRAVSELRSSRN